MLLTSFIAQGLSILFIFNAVFQVTFLAKSKEKTDDEIEI
mgnify:CR=1 FL=1